MLLFPEDELYSGTVADFSGTDSLILKNQIRTEQYDYKQLNGTKCSFFALRSAFFRFRVIQ